MKPSHRLCGVTIALLMSSVAAFGQTDYFFQPTGTDTWASNGNWQNQNGQNFQPAANFNDRAVINSGGTAFVDNTPAAPGALILGESPLGLGGNVEVRSGGALNVNLGVSQVGEPALDGSITVGDERTGTLTVLPGGTLTAAGPLTTGADAANAVTVGASSGAGAASLTASSVSLSGTTRVFSNADFNSGGALTLGSNSIYIAEIDGSSSATVAPTSAAGAATLAGSLTANFASAPAVGSSWAMIEAGSISGAFANVATNQVLPRGQSLFLSTVDLGGSQRLDLNLQEVLVLEVNRNTGVAKIVQPGASTIAIDGYSILSSQSSLLSGGWDSLSSQGALGGGWTESNPTANALSELKAIGSGSLSTDGEVALGSVYDPFAVPFGFTGDDLSFEYTSPSGESLAGIVELTGTLANNMVLQVDPVSGEARIRNSTGTDVELDAYTIESASGSLTEATWSSLADQGAAGGDWLELFGPPNDEMIGEFKPDGGWTMGPSGDSFLSIGDIFDTSGGLEDLVFQFKQDGQISAALGTVVFEEIVDNPVDLDFNGRVNSRDLLLIQRTDASLTSAWEAAFGFVEGTGGEANLTAVPEPAGAMLALMTICTTMMRRWSR